MKKKYTISNLLKALFPGGTITGCPKIRCMEIIHEVEPSNRGPYSGSFGYIGFGRQLDLNIIIRTIIIKDEKAFFHVGAGVVAAEKFGALELIDPREFTVGKLSETFSHYPQIGTLLPAMGYGNEQIKDLETTINNTDCQGVIIGTPIDLRRIIDIKHPSTRVTYDLQEIGHLLQKELQLAPIPRLLVEVHKLRYLGCKVD